MKRLILFGAAALALAACTPGAVATYNPGVTTIVSTQETLIDERALFAAEAAYNVAATAYLTAVDNGQLEGARKASSKAVLVRSYEALLAARQARSVGEASTFTTQAAAALSLAQQVTALLGRN